MNNQAPALDLSGEFTGRYLMVTNPDASIETLKEVKKLSGLNLATSRDFEGKAADLADLDAGDGIYLNEIGVAIITGADQDQLRRLSGSSFLGLLAADAEPGPLLEPERVVHALGTDFGSYLQGYKDAVDQLTERFMKEGGMSEGEAGEFAVDALAAGATYGLQRTKVVVSFPYTQKYTGKNIKVAVLDTGMDLNHPDFAGRVMVSKSFVPAQAVQDQHSHGTHCIGTACGPRTPSDASKDRYGVAYESHIYAGKVLNNAGSGADGWILAGINWAIANKCQVISMSLGAATNTSGYSNVYENAAKAALNAGCLIVAAAGNDYSKPVSHPANCPSIMAVGAVDSNLAKANFSNITFYPPHGKVDIAGPGVGTFSTVPMPGKYGFKNGTSMATPHVAGIAALWAQSSAAYRGSALWSKLVSSALALPLPVNHVGSGLVQAPYTRISIGPVNPILKPDLKPVVKKTSAKKRSTKK